MLPQKPFTSQNKVFFYSSRKLDLGSSSDEDLNEFETIINNFIKVEFMQQRFKFLPQNEQEQILQKFPLTVISFINESCLIHKSNLSIVMLGQRRFLPVLDLNEEKKQQFQFINSEAQNFLVLKINLSGVNSIEHLVTIEASISIFHNYISEKTQTLECEGEEEFKSIKRGIRSQISPFLGFNLSTFLNYFSESHQLSLQTIEELTKQLIHQVKQLHGKNIIHGDISLSNVLLITETIMNEKNKEVIEVSQEIFKNSIQEKQQTNNRDHQETGNQNSLQQFLKSQLQKVVQLMFRETGEQQPKKKLKLRLRLIDFDNSWLQPQQNNITQSHSSQHFPTQTLNYRSPQALNTRGSYPIDIWGIGHILFALLKEQTVFSLQKQWTQLDLQQIFQQEQKFYEFLKTQLTNQRHIRRNQNQIYQKIKSTLLGCLQIKPEKRMRIEELAKVWFLE